jgi:hypothetical protein
MQRATVCLILLAFASVLTQAEQYCIAYEGNDFPENVGWERTYGGGSDPAIEVGGELDGIIAIDGSLNDASSGPDIQVGCLGLIFAYWT